MQAVILAAGKSSRFYPYNTTHKSLLTVLGKPIIVHTLKSLKKSGIKDVLIVTDPNNYFKPLLEKENLGLNIEYVTLHKPSGMGDALLEAATFIKSDFYLLHPHHAEFEELRREMDGKMEPDKALILIQEKDSVSNFGVVEVQGDKVLGIIEKPEKGKEKSKFRIIGIYFLPRSFIKTLKETKPEHYSFEKALDKFAKEGRVKAVKTDRKSLSLKYPWDILSLKDFLLDKSEGFISQKAKISDKARIDGKVIVEDDASVSENAVIKGPAYIGRGVYIGTNALIRSNTSLEEGVKIGAFTEIKNSLISPKSSVHSGFIGDSVIGSSCKIGSLFNTSNVRLDRENVKVSVGGEKVDTCLRSLGAILGNNVIVGGNVSIMPGIIVGNNVNIGPSTTVMKNISSDTVFYTKFQEVVEKNKE